MSRTFRLAAPLLSLLTVAVGQDASTTPALDREFPMPGLTRFSDKGPQRIDLALDRRDLIPNDGFETWNERRVEVSPGLPGEEGLWETWRLPQGWTYRTWAGKGFTRESLREKTHRHPVLTTFERARVPGARPQAVRHQVWSHGSDVRPIRFGASSPHGASGTRQSRWASGRSPGARDALS